MFSIPRFHPRAGCMVSIMQKIPRHDIVDDILVCPAVLAMLVHMDSTIDLPEAEAHCITCLDRRIEVRQINLVLSGSLNADNNSEGQAWS